MSEENPKSLLSFVADMTGERYLKVEEDFGDGFVKLKVSEADKRQAKHDIRSVEDIAIELLRNSRDAGSNVVFFATTKERSELRRVIVIDDGQGIPRQLLERVFEPRVTSRLEKMVEDEYGIHGRGMALYAVREVSTIATVPFAAPTRGTVVRVEIALAVLPERKDQSTFPEIKRRGGELALTGPHNLPRVVMEFAIANPDIEIFYGSPAEILSTMYWLSRPFIGNRGFGECLVNPDIKFWQCAGTLVDAPKLRAFANERLGLLVSERNANRVLKAEIKSLAPITAVRTPLDPGKIGRGRLEGISASASRISENDIEALAIAVAESFKPIAEKYFLSARNPEIKREKNLVRITIELDGEEML